MPIFELEDASGAVYEIDAPDEAAALRAFQSMQGQAAPPEPAAASAPEAPKDSRLNPFNVGVASGLTANFADELFAAGMTPIEAVRGAISGEDAGKGILERVSSSYDRALAKNRELEKEAREASPVAATAGDIAGGIITSGQLAKGGATLLNAARPTYGSMIGRGAAEGAAYGAAYGAGAGEGAEDRLDKALKGGALGGALGGTLGAVGARSAANQARRAIPSTESLKEAGRAAYKSADDAGVIIKPDAMRRLSQTIKDDLAEFGYSSAVQPRVKATLDELDRVAGDNVTLKGVDVLRRVANASRMDKDPSTAELGRRMIEKIDDFLVDLKPGDILAGNKTQGIRSLQEARGLWSRASKSRMIDEALENAALKAGGSGSGGNFNNALRAEFKSILLNPKRAKAFTSEERKAMSTIVKGTKMQNLARLVGKLSPSGNGLALLTHVVGGTATGGATLPAAVIGAAAKPIGERSVVSNVERLGDIVRSGGNLPPLQQIPAKQRALLESLLVTGAQAPTNMSR